MRGGSGGCLSGRSHLTIAVILGWIALGSVGCFSPSQHLAPRDSLSATRSFPSLPGPPGGVSGDQGGPAEPGSVLDLGHLKVQESVRSFQVRHRRFMMRALARSQPYLPVVRRILAGEGVPVELAYMPIIESGYRCDAVSPSGAVGPWQFIRSTGRRYGLVIGRGVDQRRDPIRSTHAAARYLSDLHDLFGDWQLALAAYNGGEGQIQAALRRSGAGSFWELSPHLAAETRRFVPQVLAAAAIGQSPEHYGFHPLPASEVSALLRAGKKRSNRTLRYRVVRGDTLAAIARRHHISLGTLRAHNHVPNPRRLKPGRLLLIPVRSRADG